MLVHAPGKLSILVGLTGPEVPHLPTHINIITCSLLRMREAHATMSSRLLLKLSVRHILIEVLVLQSRFHINLK